jgi:hypothetical protein
MSDMTISLFIIRTDALNREAGAKVPSKTLSRSGAKPGVASPLRAH